MSILMRNMVNISICNLHKQTFLGILNKLRIPALGSYKVSSDEMDYCFG